MGRDKAVRDLGKLRGLGRETESKGVSYTQKKTHKLQNSRRARRLGEGEPEMPSGTI